MIGRQSLQVKYGLVFVVTVVLIVGAVVASLQAYRAQVLRNEAQAVAAQVVSFRSWVARSGMVWVDNLSADFHDFLAKRDDSSGSHFFGKNPALATRELSRIANESAIRATFRVTSDEYRHPDNKPDGFESVALERMQADKTTKFVEGFEADAYRYAQPIYVKEACLKCHGDPADAPKEVIEKYGADKAFGYKVGDVRGIISVSLPDLKWSEVLPTFINPVSIGLLAAAILINFLFTQYSLIRRLRRLTQNAEAIAKGDLETDLKFRPAESSHDEVDQVAHSVGLLRSSLRVAMRRMTKKSPGPAT